MEEKRRNKRKIGRAEEAKRGRAEEQRKSMVEKFSGTEDALNMNVNHFPMHYWYHFDYAVYGLFGLPCFLFSFPYVVPSKLI